MDDPSHRIRINIGLEKKFQGDTRQLSTAAKQNLLLVEILNSTRMLPSGRTEEIIQLYILPGDDKFTYYNMRMLAVLILYNESGKVGFKNQDLIKLFSLIFEQDLFAPREYVSMKVDLIKYAYVYGILF